MLNWLEGYGPLRTTMGLIIAVVCAGVGTLLALLFFFWPSLVAPEPSGIVRVPIALLAGSTAAFAMALAAFLTTIRGLLRPTYDDLFPRVADLGIAVAAAELPVWVCTSCQIIAPKAATTGPCPRCDSGVDCYLIDDDDSMRTVMRLLEP